MENSGRNNTLKKRRRTPAEILANAHRKIEERAARLTAKAAEKAEKERR